MVASAEKLANDELSTFTELRFINIEYIVHKEDLYETLCVYI